MATPRDLVRRLIQTPVHYTSTSRSRCATLQLTHSFSSSAPRRDDNDVSTRTNVLANVGVNSRPLQTRALPIQTPRPAPPTPAHSLSAMAQLSRAGVRPAQPQMTERPVNTSHLDRVFGSSFGGQAGDVPLPSPAPEPYHFHIYSHKHNTHVTVTKPNRDPIVSLSCGNLGFRKSNRKSYDAAYQLGAYVVDKLQQQGLHNQISKMEVSLRGFGPGREAVTKVLMGTEGSLLRAKISKVSDSTRLKFGGTRSKKPRRL